MIFRTFSAHFDQILHTRGDALRVAQRLPLAIIFRAFGAALSEHTHFMCRPRRSEGEDVGVDKAAGDADLGAGRLLGDGVVGSIPLEFFQRESHQSRSERGCEGHIAFPFAGRCGILDQNTRVASIGFHDNSFAGSSAAFAFLNHGFDFAQAVARRQTD